MRESRFLGSGALNLDLFYRVADLREIRFPGMDLRPGEERAGDRRTLLEFRDLLEARGEFLAVSGGGSAANTLWALARFGFPCAFTGAVGEDPEGEAVLSEMASAGVDLSRVRVKGSTGLALIVLDERKDRFILVSPGSCEEALADFRPRVFPEEWLHLSSLVSETGFSFHRHLVERAPGGVSLDPGEIYVARGPEALAPLLQRARYLFMTEREWQTLGLSRDFLRRGGKVLFLKRGARGARLVQPEETRDFPAESPSRVVDNTGAGDFFDAGVLAGLALGFPLEQCLRLGLKVAAASLSDYGRRGCPSREEFLEWIRELTPEEA